MRIITCILALSLATLASGCNYPYALFGEDSRGAALPEGEFETRLRGEAEELAGFDAVEAVFRARDDGDLRRRLAVEGEDADCSAIEEGGGEEGGGEEPGGGEEGGGEEPGGGELPPQCAGADYAAFDPANQIDPTSRVGAYLDMQELLAEAAADSALAEDRFQEAEALYVGVVSLRDQIRGSVDRHLPDEPLVGGEIDAVIMQGFALGKVADSELEVDLARRSVDKGALEFLYLSVYGKAAGGTGAQWDWPACRRLDHEFLES